MAEGRLRGVDVPGTLRLCGAGCPRAAGASSAAPRPRGFRQAPDEARGAGFCDQKTLKYEKCSEHISRLKKAAGHWNSDLVVSEVEKDTRNLDRCAREVRKHHQEK